MEKDSDVKALFIIVNAGFAENVIEIARSKGAKGATILNARGIGSVHKAIMGITVDTEKEIVLSLVDGETAGKIMEAINERAGCGSPTGGICFVLPVDRMIGTSGADAGIRK